MSSKAVGGELDNGWERALELAWDSFCGHTTPVGAVVLNSSGVMRVTGPLADGRGRFAELLHIVWLLQWPAGPHVLAAQQAALPAQVDLAGRPRTLRLFADAASSRTSLAELRSALRGAI
jgi:hypothetical protein